MSGPRQGGLRPFQPRRFGRFTLLAPLAAGGMGQIYLARARFAGGLERLCVIKKVLPELARDPGFAARFRAEAATLVALQHGSIAQVYDAGEEDGEWWIAMEFVDGKDLRRLMRRVHADGRKVPLPIAIHVAIRILEALAYAHRRRDASGRELEIVHRDVSPQNVLLSYEGEVKVIDFGLARSAGDHADAQSGVVMGKFHYMAPEQARNLPLDRRADLYAVGVILYELVTGWNPFEEAPPGEVLEWAASPRIPPVKRLAPEIPDALAAAIGRALAVDPERRPATAEEMRLQLSACLAEIDPGVGPEQLARLLRDEFEEEYRRERGWIAALSSGGAAPEGIELASHGAREGTLRFEQALPSEAEEVGSPAGWGSWGDAETRTAPVSRPGGVAAPSQARAASSGWEAAAGDASSTLPWFASDESEQAAAAGACPETRAETALAAAEPTAAQERTPRQPFELFAPAAEAARHGPEADGASPAVPPEPGARGTAGRRPTRWLAAAAGLLLLAVGGWLLRPTAPRPAAPPPPAQAPAAAAATDVESEAAAGAAPEEEAPPVEAPIAEATPPHDLPHSGEEAPAAAPPAQPGTRRQPDRQALRPGPLAAAPVQPAASASSAPAPTPNPDPVEARRTALLAQRQRVMGRYDALVEAHGAGAVGGILASLVRATDSQFQRLIDDPAQHEELRRRLEEVERLLEERQRAFAP